MDEEIAAAKAEGISLDELTSAELPAGAREPAPVSPEDVRDLLLGSRALGGQWDVREAEAGVWEAELRRPRSLVSGPRRVTFRQDILEERPEAVQHCLAWGDPLFGQLLELVPAPRTGRWGPLERQSEPEGRVQYVWHGATGPRPIRDLRDLAGCLGGIHRPPD